jgi:hypothetical protein
VPHQLTTAPSPERRLLSWGLSASQSLYDDGRYRARWINTNPLCRLPAIRPKTEWPGSEVSAPSPLPQRMNVAGDPLSGFGSPSEFHQCVTVRAHISGPAENHAAYPFRGFFPFSVLPAARSYRTPVSFHLTGHVAPLGFRSPSTPCSPHDLPSLFHPGSAHGVFPSRPCSPRNAVRSLERRDPHALG